MTQNNAIKLNVTQINCNTQHNHREAKSSQQTTARFVCMCVHCTVHNNVAHNIAQNRPDNFPSYTPDNHHRSDDVYLREAV